MVAITKKTKVFTNHCTKLIFIVYWIINPNKSRVRLVTASTTPSCPFFYSNETSNMPSHQQRLAVEPRHLKSWSKYRGYAYSEKTADEQTITVTIGILEHAHWGDNVSSAAAMRLVSRHIVHVKECWLDRSGRRFQTIVSLVLEENVPKSLPSVRQETRVKTWIYWVRYR